MKLCVPEGQKPARWQTRQNNHCCLGFEVAVEVMFVAVVTVEVVVIVEVVVGGLEGP